MTKKTKKTLREWLEIEKIGPVSNSSYEFARARALALNIKNGVYDSDELVDAQNERRVRLLRWIKSMESEPNPLIAMLNKRGPKT
jgi:hypothetical protein